MKNNLYKYLQITSFFVALLFSINSISQENGASNYDMSFEFKTVKQADNSRLLEANFTGKNKEDRKDILPIYNAEIKFFNVLNGEEVLLGSSKTSQLGVAQLIIPENQKYLTDENGSISLMARFDGNEFMEESSAELTVKNIRLELNLKEVDSVKMVLVTAFSFDASGNEIPLEETDVIIYVQGMFSKMKIAEGTISEGVYEFEMPTNLPGDANGNLSVYSSIEGHEEYGTVTQMKNIKWGVFEKQIAKNKNTLWSSAAPVWMYVVLAILLIGVWANYIYTFINLFKIKKEGQDIELEPES